MDTRRKWWEERFDITLSDWRAHGQLTVEGPVSPAPYLMFPKSRSGFSVQTLGVINYSTSMYTLLLHLCKWRFLWCSLVRSIFTFVNDLPEIIAWFHQVIKHINVIFPLDICHVNCFHFLSASWNKKGIDYRERIKEIDRQRKGRKGDLAN